MQNQKQLQFKVTKAKDGYTAQCLGHSIFTEAEDIESLKTNIKDAITCHFDDGNYDFHITLLQNQKVAQ